MRKVPLPNGAKLYLATALGEALAYGPASNAAEVVITIASALQANDLVIIDSDDYWPELTGRVARVKTAAENSITLAGVNTSNLDKFPAGGQISLIPLLADPSWQRLPYIPSFATSGGELQTGSSSYLDLDDAVEYANGRSARRLEYTVSWKEGSAGRQALIDANGDDVAVHRLVYKDGTATYYVGHLAYDDAPSTTRDEEMVTTSTVLLRHAPSFIGRALP
ncbi:phage tail protein [Corticibacter populi]|uniref:Phage tail protein n=1 Tax=Corticibacter populi TaxID=1550736 RepID=A0A3M6QUS4_9BURK|nr:phage tail tube protein [Corticibacter populi]RMX06713.1 phage tail protein [Corticibacter populi]RZS31706.1 tail tube protein [Corticibacter populi]